MIKKLNTAFFLSLITFFTSMLKVILIGANFDLQAIGVSALYISIATVIPSITNSLLSEIVLLNRYSKKIAPVDILKLCIVLSIIGFYAIWAINIISIEIFILLMIIYILALFSDFFVLGARFLGRDKLIFRIYFWSNITSVIYLISLILLSEQRSIETLLIVEIIQLTIIIIMILISLKSRAYAFLSAQKDGLKPYLLELRFITMLVSIIYQRVELIIIKFVFGLEFLGAFNLLNMTLLSFGNRVVATVELFTLKDIGELLLEKNRIFVKKYTNIVLVSALLILLPGYYVWTFVLSMALYEKYILLQSVLLAYFVFAMSKMIVVSMRPLLLALQNHKLNFSILSANFVFILCAPLIFRKLDVSEELFYYAWATFYVTLFSFIKFSVCKAEQ